MDFILGGGQPIYLPPTGLGVSWWEGSNLAGMPLISPPSRFGPTWSGLRSGNARPAHYSRELGLIIRSAYMFYFILFINFICAYVHLMQTYSFPHML